MLRSLKFAEASAMEFAEMSSDPFLASRPQARYPSCGAIRGAFQSQSWLWIYLLRYQLGLEVYRRRRFLLFYGKVAAR